MECNSCRSTDLQRLSLVYNAGLFNVKAHSIGVRGFSLHHGADQSRLSQMAAPPRKRSYVKVALLWLLGFWLAGAAISLMRPQLLGPRHQKDYGSARIEQDTVISGPVHATIDTVIGNVILAGLFALLAMLLWRVHRYNRQVHPEAIRRWNSSFMCQRCGAITQMKVSAGAA